MKRTLPILILILLTLTACSKVEQQEIVNTALKSEPSKIQKAPPDQETKISQELPTVQDIQEIAAIVVERTTAVSVSDLQIAAIVEQAASATTEEDVAAMEKDIASLEGSGLLELLETALEKSLSERANTGTKAAPGLQLALSAVYGRKGMTEKAYTAILAAETTASDPSVSFSLAVIHGRKALLAPSSKNGSFSLIVRCNTPGAVVIIDGVEQGSPPIRLEALREGSHQVSIHATGHEPYLREVEGTDGTTIELDASLNAIPVSVKAVALPSGAVLKVNGANVGTSAWEGTLVPGTHAISATLLGHQSATKTIEVLPGSVMEPISFNLQPIFAFINVTASITNVEVYTDGELKGIAPLRLKLPVESQILIRLAPINWWFGAQQRTITLSEGDDRSEHFSFEHIKATANFLADMNVPHGARIYIDKKLRGTVPFSIPDFPLGVYDLRIEASGYETYTLKWGFTGTQLAIMPMKKK